IGLCVDFFFSSRRRHTRCLSDWSSDVCSSDLRITSKVRAQDHHSPAFAYTISSRQALTLLGRVWPYLRTYKAGRACLLVEEYVRSEERRVGKEGRSGGWRDQWTERGETGAQSG